MPADWLAKKLYANLPRDMRLRKTHSLLLMIVIAVVAALAIGGGLYALHQTGRF